MAAEHIGMHRRVRAAGGRVRRSVRQITLETSRRSRRIPAIVRARRQVRTFRANDHDIDECIEFAFRFRSGDVAIRPAQRRSEIKSLLELLKERNPKTILEIGTARGGTLFLFATVAAPDAKLVSVDLPGGKFGGGYDFEVSLLLSAFARRRQQVALVRADSHSPSTLMTTKMKLDRRPVDVLLIDGDHTYEGVKADFEMYSGLVGPDGLIVFHDIAPGIPRRVGGVPTFWQELKTRFDTLEFVESWSQGGWGLGVVLRDPPRPLDRR